MINLNLIELTRPSSVVIGERRLAGDEERAAGGNGNGGGAREAGFAR